MIGYVNKTRGSSGDIVNGIIEKYKAKTSTISANTFVEFVNNNPTDTAINNSTAYTGAHISAVLLSDNKVFIAHDYSSSHYLYGVVCTIDDAVITVGTDTIINNSLSYAGNTISAVALSEDKVFIAHNGNTTSNAYHLYGIVCTINGTTITTGTDTEINTSVKYTGFKISAVALSENKIFIAHSYDGSHFYLYGMVCTVSGTTITVGTDTSISNSEYAGYVISATVLSDNKVFIAHSSGGGFPYLYGIVCTISNTTITKGTDTAVVSTSNSGNTISAATLSSDKVFIAHHYDGSNYYLYGIVCTVSGITITSGTDTEINTTTQYSGYAISAVVINENKLLITHSYGSNKYLYGIECTISGTSITKGTDTAIRSVSNSGEAISAVSLGDNKAFIAHDYNSNNYLYGKVYDKNTYVQQASTKIEALTKTECTMSNAGDVWILNN